jgi:hypothetical protein
VAPPATPAPAEPSPPKLDPKALSELALEHSRARDDLLAAEARLALLAEKVFDSRLRVRYEGQVSPPIHVTRIELDMDGSLAYRQEFPAAPSAQSLTLFDGFVPPGRHIVQLRVFAQGPDASPEALPGYFAGSGLAVHVREKSTAEVRFEADADGDPPDAAELKGDDPDGSWDVEIDSAFEIQPR